MAFNPYTGGPQFSAGPAMQGGVPPSPMGRPPQQRSAARRSAPGRSVRGVHRRPQGRGRGPMGVAPPMQASQKPAQVGPSMLQEGADPTGFAANVGNQMQGFGIDGVGQPGSVRGMAGIPRSRRPFWG